MYCNIKLNTLEISLCKYFIKTEIKCFDYWILGLSYYNV